MPGISPFGHPGRYYATGKAGQSKNDGLFEPPEPMTTCNGRFKSVIGFFRKQFTGSLRAVRINVDS